MNSLCPDGEGGEGRGRGRGHWKGWALKIETFFGPKIATSKTHVHKITSVFYMKVGEGGGSLERVGPENRDFFGT